MCSSTKNARKGSSVSKGTDKLSPIFESNRLSVWQVCHSALCNVCKALLDRHALVTGHCVSTWIKPKHGIGCPTSLACYTSPFKVLPKVGSLHCALR
eukprot:488641-Amphidinium_carterae.1